MHNLENNINEWRRQMSAGGIRTSAVLDELESHLREDVERQMRSGTNAEQAFETAVKKIGPASALKSEFRKSTSAAMLEKLMIVVAAVFVVFGIFLTSVTLILCYGSLGERLAGFTALAGILLVVFGWPRTVPFLPVIRDKQKRWAAEIVCLLFGIGITTFYVQVIVHHFENPALGGIVPVIGFGGIFPLAIGFGLASAIERAAQRATAKWSVSN